MTPSKRKPTAKPEPMPPAPSKRRPLPEAAPQHMSEPAGPFKKAKGGMTKGYAKGGKAMAKPGMKAPAKAGMKRMMGGGSCK